jgi:hypothetical protein
MRLVGRQDFGRALTEPINPRAEATTYAILDPNARIIGVAADPGLAASNYFS